MACACKVNQQIAYMQKMYGEKKPNSSEPKTHIAQDIKAFFHKTAILLILIPLIPVMAIFILGWKILKKKPIRMDEIFFRRNKR